MKREKPVPSTPALEYAQLTRTLDLEGENVLTLELSAPTLPEPSGSLRCLDRCCRRLADVWLHRWEKDLYPRACAALAEARAASRPFQPWTARLTPCLTFAQDGLLSFYLDAWESYGTSAGNTVRTGFAWDLSAGAPRSLRSFFPRRSHPRAQILEAVRSQLSQRVASGECCYYERCQECAERCFSPRRFYLTPEGLVVFYPLYTLAPRLEGIPTFSIPLPAGT